MVFVIAKADNEYSMVDWVNVLSFINILVTAISCVYDTALVGVDVLVIGCKCDAYRSFKKSIPKLHFWHLSCSFVDIGFIFYQEDFSVGGFHVIVVAFGGTNLSSS